MFLFKVKLNFFTLIKFNGCGKAGINKLPICVNFKYANDIEVLNSYILNESYVQD